MSCETLSESSDEIRLIITDVIGYVAGTCAAIITIPQIWKIIKTKKANDIALWTILLLILTSTLFTTYGVLIDSVPLIVTDVFAFILDVVMLILKLYFDHKNKEEKETVNIQLESA